MSCNRCFADWICQCLPYGSILTISSTLTPGTQYDAVFADKFDKRYKAVAEVNADGDIEINTTDLPDGLFNEWAGEFSLELFTIDSCEKVSIPVVGVYDCITLSVKGGNLNKTTIGCQ